MNQTQHQSGFTLIEVITVLVISAVALVLAATVLGAGYLKAEQATLAQTELRDVATCMENIRAAYGTERSEVIDADYDAGLIQCKGAKVTIKAVKLRANKKDFQFVNAQRGESALRHIRVTGQSMEFNDVLGR